MAERPMAPTKIKTSRRLTGNGKFLPGIPEWEALKAHCRPLGHLEAIRECALLSEQFRKTWRRGTKPMVSLAEVLDALRSKKVPFVLTGAHGIAGWTGRPRSTHD